MPASPLGPVGPVGVAIIPVMTALSVWLGPYPSIPASPSRLARNVLKRTLSEPTDRMILVAWLVAVAIVWVRTRHIRSCWLATRLMIGVARALCAPAWLQFTDRLPGILNVRFTFLELAAVGPGYTPLDDFFPQYTQLLGCRIAALLCLFPSQVMGIGLWWDLLLQAITLVVAVGAAAWPGRRRRQSGGCSRTRARARWPRIAATAA